MKAKPPGTATPVKFVTTTRDDLLAIGRILAQVVEPEILLDKRHPLIVNICGSQNGGKTTLIGAFREALLDDARMKGMSQHDEYWRGTAKGHPVEFTHIDSAWCDIYSNDALKLPDMKREKFFLQQRSIGGVSVIENHSRPDSGGLNIWVEAPLGFWEEMHEPVTGERRLYDLSGTLRDQFDAANSPISDSHPANVRYVEILVRDKRLLASDAFMQAVTGMVPLFAKDVAPRPRRQGNGGTNLSCPWSPIV